MRIVTNRLLLVSIAAVLLAVAACGGDDDDAPSVSLAAGALGCEQILEDSYQYSVQADLDVGRIPTPPALQTGQERPSFHFTTAVTGKVQDGLKLQAAIENTDGNNRTAYESIQIGDAGYSKFDERGWRVEGSPAAPFVMPYAPASVCSSFVPGIDTTALGAPEREELNGISTERYQLINIDAAFFERAYEFGPGSDAAAYIKTLNGTLWVAENGRYPAKLDFTGQGSYDTGQLLTVQIQFEVWDLGADIKIDEPPLGTPEG